MNWIGRIVLGVALVAIALLSAQDVIYPGIYLFETLSPEMFALGFAGWIISTLGPAALSILFWRFTRRVARKWQWHLLFIPCAIATLNAGASILFFAAGAPDGDSLEGRTLLAASLLLILTVLTHVAALAAEGFAKVRDRAKVS